ncbi:hypothetical protein [Bacteroides caecigallinarum]|uniref:hypothetical protein n=1 Tax=Bacteroides caecigallinarum TaxID=1411144 RepID=UPI001F3BBF80|nr:hypothetical protein [Bacteroides caecigallinarum]MCF2738430.1 hypothetical protein [Bacteroides caecigallinarum]
MSKNVNDALTYYKRCKVRCQFLEVAAMIPCQTMEFYCRLIGKTIGKTLYDKTNVSEIRYDFQYLKTLGYIVHDEGTDLVRLTDKGIETLHSGTLQNISMNAYKNYLDLKLRRLAIHISLLSLCVSIISLTLSILL